jgi:Flp pilus assembly protein TadG
MSRRHPGALRTARRSTSGQVVPIFALVVVVLFAATGLAVDAGLAYLTYNGTERAAAAAALAGVPYMPSGLPTGTFTSTTCAGTAGAAACAATARDGFANLSTVHGHPVAVTVARYPSGCGTSSNPCADNKLSVQVTAYVQPTFLHILGFGDHPVTATDTAFFLPPIALGQGGAQLGSGVDQLGAANQPYFLRSEGYGNPRSEGDAYDPYNTNQSFSCTSGSQQTAGQGTSDDVHALSANLQTDVPDGTLSGALLNKLPEGGGYNFTITVPSTVATAAAEVYNPAFSPDGNSNSIISGYNMHESDGSFAGNTDEYSAMEYTLFQVNDSFDHSGDTPLSQVVVDPFNVTISGSPLAPTSFLDVTTGQTITAATHLAQFNYLVANVYHKWFDVGNPPGPPSSYKIGGVPFIHVIKPLSSGSLATGSYRLRADMLDYKGLRPADDAGATPCSRAHRGYAMQLATPGGTTKCADPGCQVSALDELAVYTPISTAGSAGFSIPLFNLPADYAGQTINFFIFDVGDVTGTNSISILNPDSASCGASYNTTYPNACLFTTSTGVPVYDLGFSRDASLTGNLLAPNGTADACASPAVQPNGTQATVNTYPISGGCAGRSSTFFNGRWLLFQLQIPSNYAGAGGNYWQMHYSQSGGTATDTFTLVVNYANSPVHLL